MSSSINPELTRRPTKNRLGEDLVLCFRVPKAQECSPLCVPVSACRTQIQAASQAESVRGVLGEGARLSMSPVTDLPPSSEGKDTEPLSQACPGHRTSRPTAAAQRAGEPGGWGTGCTHVPSGIGKETGIRKCHPRGASQVGLGHRPVNPGPGLHSHQDQVPHRSVLGREA